jgi:nitrogen fixation NifU-like protein
MALSDELRDLYQQVILDHSRNPRNHGELTGDCVHVHGDNPTCGDEIDMWVKFGPAGQVEDIKFTGQGCAMLEDFRHVVLGDAPVKDEDSLGELILLEGVQKFPQRVKCAMLGWRALEQAMGENTKA